MQVHDSSKVNKKSNSGGENKKKSSNGSDFSLSSNSGNGNTSISNKDRQDNDDNSASAMSNLSSYSLIDDDHIDDQETINVGNLIIDLESDLEKEKIENEQANSKPTTCSTVATTTAGLPSSTSSAAATVTPSSSSFGVLPIPSGKTNQKSSAKHSNNNVTSNNNNSSNSSTINSSCGSGTIGLPGSGASAGTNSNSNNGHAMSRTVFKSSADERGELKMRITRETKPGKSEHKIVTSPNQKSPTSCSSSSNNNTTSQVNNCEEGSLHDPSSISSTKECGTSTSIGTITEPDCLGPCEPGTSVTLEGIVWQETEGGILVVNVTWRGKTYVGALLDCTKHDWAPPRLCDSPASDIDSKAHKGVRTKRIVTRSNGVGLDEKNLLQTTGKLRNGKGRRILTSNEFAPCNKRQRELEKSNENIAAQAEAIPPSANVSSITNSETASVPMNIDTIPAKNNESISTSNNSTDKAGPDSPMLIGCSEPNCSKKYRNMSGLLYHQAHAHGTDSDSNNAQDNNCSSSVKDKQIKAPLDENEQLDQKDVSVDVTDRQPSPPQPTQPQPQPQSQSQSQSQSQPQPQPTQSKPLNEIKSEGKPVFQAHQEKQRTPSPQLMLIKSKIAAPSPATCNRALINPEPTTRPSIAAKSLDQERRNSSNSTNQSNHSISNMDHPRRSPGAQIPPPRQHLLPEQQPHGHTPNNHSSSSRSNSSKQQSNNPAPLPATTEEGMKPSGTSTGPPPAPHQANCYFNQSFMTNNYGPYMGPFTPYFARPLFDAPPTPSLNASMLSRCFLGGMRLPPPPDSPSRLANPSMMKNLPPYPPFKVDPGSMPPVPNPQLANPSLSSMSPLSNPPPLASGSPHLRMASQVDPMLPPTSQPTFPPSVGMNPMLGVPGPVNPMGPMGGPQVPLSVEETRAKQFPRARFN